MERKWGDGKWLQKDYTYSNGNNILTRYSLGNCYELDQTSTSKEKLYLFSDFYGAGAVYIKDGSLKGIIIFFVIIV